MKIILFGMGSIGQRHARLLQQYHSCDLFAFRSSPGSPPNKLGIPEIHTWREFEKIKPDIAFITNPTSLHIDTAIACAERKCHLFIEKPLGVDIEGVNKLISIIKKNNLTSYVAYNLRFDPVIVELKKYIEKNHFLHMRVIGTSYLPCWRPAEDYKKSYSANRQMGGGVLLDLSHEIDLTAYLLGEVTALSGRSGRLSNLTKDAEDYADILALTVQGPASIHINFLSHYRSRTIQADFRDITVVGDLVNHTVEEFTTEVSRKKIILEYNCDQTYLAEQKYFFDNLKNPGLMNNVGEAAKLFKTIIQLKQEIQKR